ncbi:MAG: polysaccharide deacetylase family protein [Gemmatimonadales bacterium]
MRAILTYHSIDGSGSPISIDAASFARHVEWLASGRVRVVPLEEIEAGGAGAEDAVALTFDDAFRNFATDAAPRLLDRGLPVTVFVVTDQVGRSNAWGGRADPRLPELPLLDWDELGRLAERGVTIGSHTRTHPRLSKLPAEVRDGELEQSAERLERELGARPRWIAYPYGDVSPAVRDAAARRYAGGVTVVYRPLSAADDRYRLPRLDAWYFRKPGSFDRWNRPDFRSRIWARRQARSARRLFERARGVG